MKVRQAADLIRKHPNTLRNYLERFPEYFSVQPDKGKQRHLTDDDVRVLAFIVRLSDSGMDQNAIGDALAQKQAAGSPFPPVTPPPPEADSPALVPVLEMERRVAEAHAEVRELQGRLDEMRLHLTEQTESFRQREQQLMDEINRLNREIGGLLARQELDDED